MELRERTARAQDWTRQIELTTWLNVWVGDLMQGLDLKQSTACACFPLQLMQLTAHGCSRVNKLDRHWYAPRCVGQTQNAVNLFTHHYLSNGCSGPFQRSIPHLQSRRRNAIISLRSVCCLRLNLNGTIKLYEN
jgi:hypothetical protein